MGGRKSYSSRKLVGGSKGAKQSFATLKDVLDKSQTKKVGVSALDVFSSSKKTLDYTSYATKLTPHIIRNYKKWNEEKDDNKVRREISKAWGEVKQKNKISTPKQVDRVIIDNALKSLRGGSSD